MIWIKCHDTLVKGRWSGVPRAYRFVLLELSLTARPLDGTIELPIGSKSHEDGLVDLLGGNRREARAAVRYLVSDGTLSCSNRASNRCLTVVIPAWAVHNACDRSAARMRKLRAKRKDDQVDSAYCDASRDGAVTRHVTRTVTSRDALRERVEIDPPYSPPKVGQGGASAPPSNGSLFGSEKSQGAEKRDNGHSAEIAEVWKHWLEHWKRARGTGAAPQLNTKRRRQILRRIQEGYSVEQLKQAANGIWKDPFCLEGGHTQPETCYRDGGQVERYAGKCSLPRGSDDDRPELRRYQPRARGAT